MAISPMKKLSLVIEQSQVDALLVSLQEFGKVEISDLKQGQDWKDAFKNKEVVQVAREVQDLVQEKEDLTELIYQLETFMPSKSFFKKLKEKPLEISFSQLEEIGHLRDEEVLKESIKGQLQALADAEKEIVSLKKEIAALSPWQRLDITPKELEGFCHLQGVIGTLPNHATDALLNLLYTHPDVELEEVFTNETEQGLILFYRSTASQKVEEWLARNGFKAFDYEKKELPKDYLCHLKAQLKKATAQKEACLATLKASKVALDSLKMQVDYLLNRSSRQSSKGSLLSTTHLVALEGWIEEDQFEPLKVALTEQFNGQILLQVTDISKNEWEKVPTKLSNAPLMEPFELVTEMYALPKYGETDPTPFVSFFYFLFFGMMVADIGYGLVLFLGTSFALRQFHVKPSMAKSLRFFRLLGVSVVLWGAIYGSFFGFELPFSVLSTRRDIMSILVLSVLFGFITILTGLWFSGQKHWRLKDYGQAYHSGFAWILILLGLAFLVLGKTVSNLSFLIEAGKWLALLNAIGILIVSLFSSKKLTGLISGLFNLYNISSYVGDLVSFTRLMALGLAGASMGSAFNLIVSLFPPLVRFSIGLVIFLILHAVNMSLSFLSGYVHSARLIFVEFFGKFYEGGGFSFRPLKPVERYVKHKK